MKTYIHPILEIDLFEEDGSLIFTDSGSIPGGACPTNEVTDPTDGILLDNDYN